ncbi:MAG TPA: hypothetical protein VLW25_01905 [Bryobacteraceae bacterium]|nr:hypothetical protein [Bryobacteraceae bacterium]
MSATRIVEALQPGSARIAALITDTSATFISKVQAFLEETAAASRELFEKQLANVLIILLAPASMVALVFGLWRLGSDLAWTGTFVISDGFFSHWQVWLALAAALRLAAWWLQSRVHARAKTFEEN